MNNYTLLSCLNELLQPEKFKDYCPNGLQVEGNSEVNNIVTGVSLNDELIEQAVSLNAQAIIVHHGIFWHNEDHTLRGVKRNRIAKLLKHGINLYAYHLPLDNHPQLGNNVRLADLLGIQVHGQADTQDLLWFGEIPPIKTENFAELIKDKLNRPPLIFSAQPNKLVCKVAWCTGGADSFFNTAIDLGVDAYITGEAAEPSQAMAYESGVAFIAAGHYATERYGISALSEYLSRQYSLQTQFIDLYNPV